MRAEQEPIKTQLVAASTLWILKSQAEFCGAGSSPEAQHPLLQHTPCQYPPKITAESKHGEAGKCLKDPLLAGMCLSSLRKKGVKLSYPF